MLFLGYAYRFLSNFVFLALVYLALNFLEKYQNRVVVAVLVLIYAGISGMPAQVQAWLALGDQPQVTADPTAPGDDSAPAAPAQAPGPYTGGPTQARSGAS